MRVFPEPLSPDSPLWDCVGIYMITAPAKAGEFRIAYVGRTYGKTTCFRDRFADHMRELRDGEKLAANGKTTYWLNYHRKYNPTYSLAVLELIEPGASMDYVNERETLNIQRVRDRLGLRVFNSKHCDGAGFNGRCADDPLWRANNATAMRALAANPEWRVAQVARARALAADPECRARNVASNRALAADPSWHEANAARGRALAADPSWREANVARSRALVADPVWR